jgi:hypothetical protein
MRKLRAGLVVEEQRKDELSKILKEVLSSPDSSGSCQTKPERRVNYSIFFLYPFMSLRLKICLISLFKLSFCQTKLLFFKYTNIIIVELSTCSALAVQ